MKIVIDARQLRATGVGRYIERLLHYLQIIDKQNDYIVLIKPQDIHGWQPSNPRFKKLASPYREFSFGEQLGLWRQLRSLRPDLVHFGVVQQPIGYRGPVVTTMHDLTTLRFDNPAKNFLVFRFKQLVYKWVNLKAARKSRHIIVPSEFVKQDVVRFAGIKPDKISVTYESADPITWPAEPLPDLKDKDFIMYVGRPLPHKNLRRLIDAFKILQADHPQLWLVLAGKREGLYDHHAKYARRQGIKNLYFTGQISDGQLRWLYEHTKAYVFPSLSEGFGLPGLEAMQAGAPVVSSNATCLPEIYGQAAEYFDPLNPADMAAKIGLVVDDPKRQQTLIKAGTAQIKKYSWAELATQTLEIYQKARLP